MCIVGRNQADNHRLESLAASSDILLRSVDHPGPVGLLLPSSRMGQDLDLAALAVIAYSDTPLSAQANVEWRQGREQGTSSQCNLGKDSLKAYQV